MYCDWPVLGRCCFCLPLRRGVLTFGYINLFFSAFLTGVYSFAVHHSDKYPLMYHVTRADVPAELCVALYCLEVVFSAVLIYGTHTKTVACIKGFYYFSVTTLVAVVVLQIIEAAASPDFGIVFEILVLIFTSLCIQIYLIILVSSLLRKLDRDGPHTYENQLHQIITGEKKIESNGIYSNPTVEPIPE